MRRPSARRLTRGEFEAEYRIQRQDGQIRWVMSRGQTHCDDTGQPIRMIGVTLDVTERRQTAEELRRSEERFRLLIEGIADYAILCWTRLDLSPVGTAERNVSRDTVPGNHRTTLLMFLFGRRSAPGSRPWLCGKRRRKAGSQTRDGGCAKTGLDSGRIPYLTSLHDQQGELIGFAKFTRDLTESRKAEEAVQAAQAELARVVRATTLGELTASIAHEINQPLAAIVNNANASRRILAGPAPDLEEVRQAVTEIAEAGTRTGEIVSRVRSLLKKTAPERRPLDINQVIREVLALIPNELEKQHVAVEMELEAAPPPVLGDRVQLQQVLLNLIMNGMEAMNSVSDRPRVLMLQSHAGASGLEVTVQDSGTGLDPRHVPHLFDTFFTTKTTGMGMGLSISRSIIEAHSGRLWASPNRAAQGAAFHFSLPAIA